MFKSSIARRLGYQLDVGRGSLWWVRESQWRKVLARQFDSNGGRERHPALSILDPQVSPGPAERVPVLFGTTKRRGNSVVVRGLSRERGPDHKTHFLYVSPRVSFAFTTFDQEECVDPNQKHPAIQPNRFKPRVTDAEMRDLETFLDRKGLL